jgi:sialate O-acetylesterase
MEYTTQAAFNHTAEISASELPGLRLATVAKVQARTPQADAKLETYGWGVSSPATLQDPNTGKAVFGVPFSATCYYFGRELHLSLGKEVPVGLVASSWGGCAIQPWMRAGALAKCTGHSDDDNVAAANGGMFNAMMAPFANLRLSGMLWDQVCGGYPYPAFQYI